MIEKEKFKKFLLKKMSERTVKDVLSRCKRIKKEICPNLDKTISTQEGYNQLLEKIHLYAEKNSVKVTTAYSISSNLRYAARNLANFLYPNINTSDSSKKRIYEKYK